jgi:cobalamin synthase
MFSNIIAMMDHVFMNFNNVRYYIWVCSLVLGSAGLYTLIVVGGIKQIIPLEGSDLRTAYIVAYIAISFFCLLFFIPRLRNVWLGEMMDEKYISLRGSWIGIVIGAATGTIVFIPQVKKIEFLDEVPYLLIVAVMFLVFTLILFYLSFYTGQSRRRR